MRLTDYWGVGPKTRDLLIGELGESAALEAIEAADVRTLTTAGLSRGRATRILRRADGGAGLDALATRDTRSVYRDVLDRARTHALTRHAADRIQVLTPLADRDAMTARLERVEAAMDTWRALSSSDRGTVQSIFETYDDTGGDRLAAVTAVLALHDRGITEGVFDAVSTVDEAALEDAADALRSLDGGDVGDGVDERLDALRTAATATRRLERDPADVLETVRRGDVRDSDAFQAALVRHVAEETGLDAVRVREATPSDAADAADFVTSTLRTLASDVETEAAERARTVTAGLENDLSATEDSIDSAVALVDKVTLDLSLARFALAYDMSRPTYTDAPALGVRQARNLGLSDSETDVQPISYGLGAHGIDLPDERISVLTGANSGGKTTLLETLCQIVLLARMGLPVPADEARLSPDFRVVFHRRHASFNAGVLESTLRSIVPPLTEPGPTLMLVDEFEAITEPGSAADLLHGLVRLSVGEGPSGESDTLGTFVTHLADDLEPLPPTARIDGISARGLDANLELEVDYQPRFHEVGRSTPEFIVSRLLADAADARSRSGFETLAAAVGQEPVQRTLDDVLFHD